MKNVISIAAVVLSLSLSAVGCHTKPKRFRATMRTSAPWQIGLAKTCLFKDDSKDGMDMKCASFGDPDIGDRYTYLVDADFNKPVHNSGGVFGVICRLDSYDHATCQVD